MSIKASRYYGFGLALLAVSAFAACSSEDDPGTNNTAGTGNSTAGSTGTAGSGLGGSSSTAGTGNTTAGTGQGTAGSGTAGSGTAGSGGSGGGSNACKGTMPTSNLITGFEDAVADAMNVGQFKFMLGTPGGTYSYPAGLTADVSGKALNIKGNIMGYSGFGIYLNDCTNAAGAGATGVSFNIKGNVGTGGMLSFRVETNATTPAANGKGTCPPGAMWEVCHPGEFAIPVTAGGAEVMVTWDKLMGGVPVATVDGKDIVGFQWAFAWADPPPAAYMVDVTVDDIKFMGTITGGGGTGAGGSGGAGGGGAGGMAGGGAGGAGGTAGGGAGGTQP